MTYSVLKVPLNPNQPTHLLLLLRLKDYTDFTIAWG